MATVVHVPKDTRAGDLGRAAGSLVGGFFARKKEREKQEAERDLINDILQAKDRDDAFSKLGAADRSLFDDDSMDRIMKVIEESTGKDLAVAGFDSEGLPTIIAAENGVPSQQQKEDGFRLTEDETYLTRDPAANSIGGRRLQHLGRFKSTADAQAAALKGHVVIRATDPAVKAILDQEKILASLQVAGIMARAAGNGGTKDIRDVEQQAKILSGQGLPADNARHVFNSKTAANKEFDKFVNDSYEGVIPNFGDRNKGLIGSAKSVLIAGLAGGASVEVANLFAQDRMNFEIFAQIGNNLDEKAVELAESEFKGATKIDDTDDAIAAVDIAKAHGLAPYRRDDENTVLGVPIEETDQMILVINLNGKYTPIAQIKNPNQ